MENLHTKKTSNGSNSLIRQMSVNQKSGRQTFRRRFVSGSLFVSPCPPECYLQSETNIEPDLRLSPLLIDRCQKYLSGLFQIHTILYLLCKKISTAKWVFYFFTGFRRVSPFLSILYDILQKVLILTKASSILGPQNRIIFSLIKSLTNYSFQQYLVRLAVFLSNDEQKSFFCYLK